MSQGRFNLSALAVRERSVTLFLIILVTIAGIYAFFGLGRAEDPPFTVKQMTVITVWPGANAQEMLYPARHGLYHALTPGQYAAITGAGRVLPGAEEAW